MRAILSLLAIALALMLPPSAEASGMDETRELDLSLLPRLLESYDRSRHIAKQALALHDRRGIAGLLDEAEDNLRTASRPALRLSSIAHEWYAATAWFHGVLALMKSGEAAQRGAPTVGSSGLPLVRAAAFFRLTDGERLRLFAKTEAIFATAEARLAEEREREVRCTLSARTRTGSVAMLHEGRITVPGGSRDAAILLAGCAERTPCLVTYIGDGDGDFLRVVAARPAPDGE